MDQREGSRIVHQPALCPHRARHRVIERRKRVEQHFDGLAELPGCHGRRRRVDRHRLFGPLARPFRGGLGVCVRVIRLEKLVIGMCQLDCAAVVAHLAGEDAAHARLQVGFTPGLVEKGEGEDVAAVADRHLEDRPFACPHRALLHPEHFGDDRDVLVDRQLSESGELTAEGVSSRIVGQQVTNGHQPEALFDRRRRATAEGTTELGVERGVHLDRLPPGPDG